MWVAFRCPTRPSRFEELQWMIWFDVYRVYREDILAADHEEYLWALSCAGCLLTAENLLNLGRVEKRTLFQVQLSMRVIIATSIFRTYTHCAYLLGQILIQWVLVSIWFNQIMWNVPELYPSVSDVVQKLLVKDASEDMVLSQQTLLPAGFERFQQRSSWPRMSICWAFWQMQRNIAMSRALWLQDASRLAMKRCK